MALEERETNVDIYKWIEEFNENVSKLIENCLFNLTDGHNDDSKKVGLELKKLIDRNKKLYQDILTSKRIGCVICETGNHWLIDGILKERISGTLEPQSEYMIVTDGFSTDIQTYEKLSALKVISRPKNQWRPLENSFVFLSPRNHMEFIDRIQSSHLCNTCLLILVLQSPSELRNDEIKSFLSKVGKDYRDGNFILVFDESDRKACTKLKECKKCFPEPVLSFLKTTNIKFENRIFKVSILFKDGGNELVEVTIPNKTHLDKFDDLKAIIENELHLETIVDNLFDNIVRLCKCLTDCRPYLNKEVLKDLINQYYLELKNNSNRLKEEIENHERNEMASLVNFWTTKLENESEFTETDIADSFIERYKSVFNDFGKSLINLSDTCSTKIGTLANYMFWNKYQKVEEINDKVKGLVKVNFKNIDEASFKEYNVKNQAKDVQRFVDAIGIVNKEIFEVPKKAFEKFFEEFECDVCDMVEEIKKRITDEVNKSKELGLSSAINDYLKKLKLFVRQEILTIRKEIEVLLNNIQKVIKKKDKCNINPKSLGFFIVEVIRDIDIQYGIKDINNKLVSHLNPIFKDINNVCCEDLFNFKEVDILAIRCEKSLAIFIGTLNEDKYYQIEMDYSNWLLKLFDKKAQMKFIKFNEIMKEFHQMQNSIFNNIDEINKIINKTINTSIKLRELIENERNKRMEVIV